MARKIKWVASEYAYDILDELLEADGGLSRASASALQEARKACAEMRDEEKAFERKHPSLSGHLEEYRDAIKLIDCELTRHRAFLKRQGDLFGEASA